MMSKLWDQNGMESLHEALEKWIDNLSEQQRQAIRFASIDMWAPYYYAVRNRLPHVQISPPRIVALRNQIPAIWYF